MNNTFSHGDLLFFQHKDKTDGIPNKIFICKADYSIGTELHSNYVESNFDKTSIAYKDSILNKSKCEKRKTEHFEVTTKEKIEECLSNNKYL